MEKIVKNTSKINFLFFPRHGKAQKNISETCAIFYNMIKPPEFVTSRNFFL
jgi:hypothetical protein